MRKFFVEIFCIKNIICDNLLIVRLLKQTLFFSCRWFEIF